MQTVNHVVPYIVAIRKSPGPLRVDLQETLHKIRKQLNVKCDSEKYIQGDSPSRGRSVSLISYTEPEIRGLKESLPKYIPIRRFNFNREDYAISSADIRNASSEFPESRYPVVKKGAPICTNFEKLKGPNSDLYTLAVLRGITKQKSLHKCKWFTFNYWHSNTYLGRILKSRPGVMVVCHNFNIFNASTADIKGSIPSSMQNTSYPFKFSVYRTRMRKLLRKHFMQLYLQDKVFAKAFDGFYRFSCTLYPLTEDDLEDFVKHIDICLKKVSKTDLATMKKAASREESKIPWQEVIKVLSRNNVSPVGIVPSNRRGKED